MRQLIHFLQDYGLAIQDLPQDLMKQTHSHVFMQLCMRQAMHCMNKALMQSILSLLEGMQYPWEYMNHKAGFGRIKLEELQHFGK